LNQVGEAQIILSRAISSFLMQGDEARELKKYRCLSFKNQLSS